MTNTMSNESVIRYGKWKPVDICRQCGAVIYDRHQSNCCSNCGAVGFLIMDVYSTSRRYCYTYIPPWFKFWEKPKGYYEWSGKRTDGVQIPASLMAGRRLSSQFITITAAGIASGLF